MYVAEYICIYVSEYVCMYVYMYVCKCVCMYITAYVCMYLCKYASNCVCMYVCMYVFMFVLYCMYVPGEYGLHFRVDLGVQLRKKEKYIGIGGFPRATQTIGEIYGG